MKRKILWLALGLSPLCVFAAQGAFAAAPAATPENNPAPATSVNDQQPANELSCEMSFTLSGWSVIYHAANGHGMVSCENGKKIEVNLAARGAGLTVGKYKVKDGHGTFSGVTRISQVLGTYGMARAHAGAAKSARAVVMTKGDVTLALAGHGVGWNIGAGFAGFTISRADGAAADTTGMRGHAGAGHMVAAADKTAAGTTGKPGGAGATHAAGMINGGAASTGGPATTTTGASGTPSAAGTAGMSSATSTAGKVGIPATGSSASAPTVASTAGMSPSPAGVGIPATGSSASIPVATTAGMPPSSSTVGIPATGSSANLPAAGTVQTKTTH